MATTIASLRERIYEILCDASVCLRWVNRWWY